MKTTNSVSIAIYNVTTDKNLLWLSGAFLLKQQGKKLTPPFDLNR
jgi:hypothetical protein